ncbi:MAG: hypothetical protein IPM48_15015 [Saprospiraceae bacterium]|nr:hypothetical protein [Saprospiraceae bacterium]
MEDSQYKNLLKAIERIDKRVDSVSADVNRIDKDMADDRKDFSDINLRLKNLEQSEDETRKSIAKLQQKTNDAVVGAVERAVKPLEDKIDQWVEKKVIRTKAVKTNIIDLIRDHLNSLKNWRKGGEVIWQMKYK